MEHMLIDSGEIMSNKLEQRINLQFLFQLGKNEHEAYQMLRKVYREHCMSRSCAIAYYTEYNKILEQQCKVEETEKLDVDNTASSSRYRARSNSHSVIDSIGFRKYKAVVGPRLERTRSKSLTSNDYFMSTEQHQSIVVYSRDNESVEETSQSIGKKLDTTDGNKLDTTDARADERISPDQISGSTCSTFDDAIAIAPTAKDADCYNMNHKNRGKCIIFNHEEFNLSYEKREGTALDANRLKKTFKKLGFDVECHDNFTYSQIMDRIDKVSQINHTDNDCLCVITLTHGIQNDLLCAKDVIYKSDSLWKPFTADKCKTLAGKPKLFFIQACRGNESDSGIKLASRSLIIKTETDSAVSYAIPTHADFLIAHSSIEGFFTWRNPLEGTWYIQCLCDILDQHGATMDLMSMLTRTARKVATEFSSVTDNLAYDNKRQVPSVTSMLIRNVYFPPKSNDHVTSFKKESDQT